MINRRGRRFVDEGEDGAMFTYAKYGRAILAEPGAKAYQIFDSQVVHLLEPRHATSEPITADTLEDLVAQLDIDDKAQVTVPTGGRSAASSPAGRWSAASFTTITRPAPASFPAPPLAASPAAPRRSSIRPAAHDLRLDQS